jgi:hypothetical protein
VRWNAAGIVKNNIIIFLKSYFYQSIYLFFSHIHHHHHHHRQKSLLHVHLISHIESSSLPLAMPLAYGSQSCLVFRDETTAASTTMRAAVFDSGCREIQVKKN